jgi:hypothetical protein
MNTFNKIRKMIENIEIWAGEDDVDAEVIMQAHYKIFNQFETAAQAQWTKSELKDFIFENDVLDFVENNDVIVQDGFRDDVREIQYEIIEFFGEEEEE